MEEIRIKCQKCGEELICLENNTIIPLSGEGYFCGNELYIDHECSEILEEIEEKEEIIVHYTNKSVKLLKKLIKVFKKYNLLNIIDVCDEIIMIIGQLKREILD